MSDLKIKVASGSLILAGIIGIIVLWSSWFITPEGHVDVVKRFGKATHITQPGLNFKLPLVDTNDTIEVRTRKNVEEMSAATAEQMPVNAVVSMNWSANPETILDLYKSYGSLEQFEFRVIDPKFRAITKESIAKFTAEETINKRDQVEQRLRDYLTTATQDLPIKISSLNIENIELPKNYLQSIEVKQTEKNLADAEVFKLEKQNLEAQRAVNTANAEAQSITVKAKAEADAIKLKGEAEAKAIEAKSKALQGNPLIVELTKAQQWNGALPTYSLGEGSNFLLDMRK